MYINREVEYAELRRETTSELRKIKRQYERKIENLEIARDVNIRFNKRHPDRPLYATEDLIQILERDLYQFEIGSRYFLLMQRLENEEV